MKMPVVYLNLRDYSFNRVDTLVAVLHTKMSTWMDKFKETATKFNLNMAVFGLTFQIGFKSNKKFAENKCTVAPKDFLERRQSPCICYR